jgi:hypothetical protein
MTKKRFSIVMLVLLGLYVALRFTSEDGIVTQIKDRARKVFASNVKNNAPLGQVAVTSSSDQTLPETTNQTSQKTDEEFTTWVQTQTQNLEVPTNDPIEFERKTKEFVNQLNPSQLQQLKDKVLNLELPMNERIFSNYAMIQFEGDAKNEFLKDLLNAPVPEFPDPKPHTSDEVRRGQEYALRYMEIDELFRRAEAGDLQAGEILAQLAQNHSDMKILNYAKRKLKEIRK